jgi:AcrR family transcriptional regulator
VTLAFRFTYDLDMSAAPSSALRADAELNRQRLLSAAREVFAERGLDVSLRQIALRAGVGEPTLRRRFPSKAQLIAEAFQDKVATYADEAERALQTPDAWTGFSAFVSSIARMQLGDRGFTDVLTMTFPESMRAEKDRRRAYAAIGQLIGRAQHDGTLRPDFSPEDIVLVLMAHAGVVAAAGELAPAFSQRMIAYFLDAFAAPAREELPAAPSAAATYRALLGLHHTRSVER